MNMMDSNPKMHEAQPNFGYITEFKQKTELEERINSAWRRAEPETGWYLVVSF